MDSLLINQEYYWHVRAANTTGNGPWSETWKFTTVLDVVNAPSNLIATTNAAKEVYLSWVDNSSNENNFIIERKTGDSLSTNIYNLLTTLPSNSISYLDTLNLEDTTKYTYRVKAWIDEDIFSYSNQAEITTLIPVELTSFYTLVGERDIKLLWVTASERNNRGFEIERKLISKEQENQTWINIGFSKGKGTTTEQSNYDFYDSFDRVSFIGKVQYRLKQIDFSGSLNYSEIIEADANFLPKAYALMHNYPNPFNPLTLIRYELPNESSVKLIIYNSLGQVVKELVNEVQQSGYYEVNFNAGNLSSGIYYYSISAASTEGNKEFREVKKLMLLK
jgi:hypothetical protein